MGIIKIVKITEINRTQRQYSSSHNEDSESWLIDWYFYSLFQTIQVFKYFIQYEGIWGIMPNKRLLHDPLQYYIIFYNKNTRTFSLYSIHHNSIILIGFFIDTLYTIGYSLMLVGITCVGPGVIRPTYRKKLSVQTGETVSQIKSCPKLFDKIWIRK